MSYPRCACGLTALLILLVSSPAAAQGRGGGAGGADGSGATDASSGREAEKRRTRPPAETAEKGGAVNEVPGVRSNSARHGRRPQGSPSQSTGAATPGTAASAAPVEIAPESTGGGQ
jgi:hypothetical protein